MFLNIEANYGDIRRNKRNFNIFDLRSYFRLIHRQLFTAKFRLSLIIVIFIFLLLCLLQVFQKSNSVNLDINKFEYEEKINSHKSYFNYAVMIDAGSSGSRVHLYSWPPHSGDKRKLLQIKMVKNELGNDLYKRITPGLSSFAAEPEKAFDYIYPLIQFASDNIPSSKHKETPLYILATAGMRLLNIDSQNAILDTLRKKISQNCTFLFASTNAQVITGKEEGIYSWISVNYLLGRFDHSVSTHSLITINFNNGITTRPRTVGMLEMGGASVQIAFEITNKYEIDEIKRRKGFSTEKDLKNVIAKFNLGCSSHEKDHDYLLYVTTFLGLGANVARETYLKELIVHHKKRGVKSSEMQIKDPCLCKKCVYNITININGSSYDLSLIGIGDFELCEIDLTKLLNPKSEKQQNCNFNASCPLTDLSTTRVSFGTTEFYGFSELWYSMEDVLRIGGKYDYFSFKKVASEFCSTNYQIIKERLAKNLYPLADEARILDECFKAAWISTVLHKGLKMPKTYKYYRSAYTINNNQVQWTLGALLYRTRFFPLRNMENNVPYYRYLATDPTSYYTNHILFALCMLIVCASIVIYLKHLNRMISKNNFTEKPEEINLLRFKIGSVSLLEMHT